jgi:hypothetical protein
VSVALWLLVLAVGFNGLLAGASLDGAAVKLPTRRRIGSVAYANFARGNDLGNGLVVYPAAGVLVAMLVFGATIAAYLTHQPIALMVPLLLASAGTIAHSVCTAKAAPVMLSLKRTPDEEAVLTAKLDRFAFWHGLRATFQISTFVVLLWALVVATRQP